MGWCCSHVNMHPSEVVGVRYDARIIIGLKICTPFMLGFITNDAPAAVNIRAQLIARRILTFLSFGYGQKLDIAKPVYAIFLKDRRIIVIRIQKIPFYFAAWCTADGTVAVIVPVHFE